MGFQPLERSDRGILGIGVAMFSQLDIGPMAACGWASSVRVPFALGFYPRPGGITVPFHSGNHSVPASPSVMAIQTFVECLPSADLVQVPKRQRYIKLDV